MSNSQPPYSLFPYSYSYKYNTVYHQLEPALAKEGKNVQFPFSNLHHSIPPPYFNPYQPYPMMSEMQDHIFMNMQRKPFSGDPYFPFGNPFMTPPQFPFQNNLHPATTPPKKKLSHQDESVIILSDDSKEVKILQTKQKKLEVFKPNIEKSKIQKNSKDSIKLQTNKDEKNHINLKTDLSKSSKTHLITKNKQQKYKKINNEINSSKRNNYAARHSNLSEKHTLQSKQKLFHINHQYQKKQTTDSSIKPMPEKSAKQDKINQIKYDLQIKTNSMLYTTEERWAREINNQFKKLKKNRGKILIGKDFQATIPKSLNYSQNISCWKQIKKNSLQARKIDQ